MMKKKELEVLAPAGSYESMLAAIAAGADAIYIGGTKFGARAFANNLDEERMLEAIDYVHLHGKKIYLTVNTLLKDDELKNELYMYLLPFYKRGIDAVIVQDIGVLTFVKQCFPDLPIHASTQMTLTNVYGVKFLEKLGVERIVTSREMNVSEIKEISEQTDLEIESFVHGALCYCYSGQCLFSSMIGGRSGNRGQCAQPCRLPYQAEGTKTNQYLLSLKDICTLEYIPELIECGISSFKIEGRMKKPEYVALVTSMYRKYIDLYYKVGKDKYRVDEKDREMLMDLYNRGGSCGGYYHTHNGKDMLALNRPNHAGVPVLKVLRTDGKKVFAKVIADIHKGDVIELPDEKETYTFSQSFSKGTQTSFLTYEKQDFKKINILNRTRNESLLKWINETIIDRKVVEQICGKLILSVDKPAELHVNFNNVYVCVFGDIVQLALNQPMDKERIEKQMRKTGNTAFAFSKLEIELYGNVFVPVQALNELRRRALEELQQKLLEAYYRNSEKPPQIQTNVSNDDLNQEEKTFSAYVESLEQWKVILEYDFIHRVYVDCNAVHHMWISGEWLEFIETSHSFRKELYLAMPYVFRKSTIQFYEKLYSNIFIKELDGVMVRNFESCQFLKEHHFDKPVVTDHNVYQMNQYAKDFWLQEGIDSLTAPLELNVRELQLLGVHDSELIVYGYYPMMITAQCVHKTIGFCDKQTTLTRMKDRYNKYFSVRNNCNYCYNVIYNSAPVVLLDQKKEISQLSPRAKRLNFTIENADEVKCIVNAYKQTFIDDLNDVDINIEFTRGHFKRGIK